MDVLKKTTLICQVLLCCDLITQTTKMLYFEKLGHCGKTQNKNKNAMICKCHKPILYSQNKCLNWNKLLYKKHSGLFWIWWSNILQKTLGSRPYLSLYSIPSSFNNSLGTEETTCWSFKRGAFSQSYPMLDYSCSTVLGFVCHIFLYMMLQMFSFGERAAQSCWNMQGLP